MAISPTLPEGRWERVLARRQPEIAEHGVPMTV